MNILDSRFKYVPAAATDLRAKFKKIERARAKAWDDAHAENAFRNMMPVNVSAIKVKRVVK